MTEVIARVTRFAVTPRLEYSDSLKRLDIPES
jgi:hypothetical protein